MKILTADAAVKALLLQAAPVFRTVDSKALRAIADMAVMREYKTDETLFRHGQTADGFFILARGALSVFRTAPDGRRQILHVFHQPGDVCGEVPVFEGGAYPATAEATEPSRLLYLPRADFLSMARQHPDILISLLAELSRRMQRFVKLIEDLALKDVGARLAGYLLEAAGTKTGDTVRLTITKTALASRLGTIAETLSRTLRKLQQAGLIAVEGRVIRIRDREKLEALAAGEVQR